MRYLIPFMMVMAGLSLFFFSNCKRKAEVTDSSQNDNMPAASVISLDLVKLREQGNMPPEVEVEIEFDHVFKKSKLYRAYSIQALLAPYLQQLGLDSTSNASVTFYCSDGYQPTQKLSELLSAEGFLAFHDQSVGETGQDWPDSVQAKFRPFYLVWRNMPYEDQLRNWSYGLYQLDIHPVDDVYEAIIPKNDLQALAGFGYFQHYCIKCHSINRIGGNVGPEFNDPKNITEYWEVEKMWAYAKDPRSFRFNAHMEPMTDLTRAEFDRIIAYLQYIKPIKPQ